MMTIIHFCRRGYFVLDNESFRWILEGKKFYSMIIEIRWLYTNTIPAVLLLINFLWFAFTSAVFRICNALIARNIFDRGLFETRTHLQFYDLFYTSKYKYSNRYPLKKNLHHVRNFCFVFIFWYSNYYLITKNE